MSTEKKQPIDPIIKLFINWHNNADPQAGIKMADRFELWFDSLSSFYLGENSKKQEVYKTVCLQFSNNIKQIKKPKDLVPFAYSILHKELPKDVSEDKEYSPAMLQNRSAEELIRNVWGDLSTEDQNILVESYQGKNIPSSLYQLLQARTNLKQHLQTQGIDFLSLNDVIDRDLFPLPLFEANKLKSAAEIQYFEFWLLNAPAICRDILEFAPFAHALRMGIVIPSVIDEKDAAPLLSDELNIPEKQEVSPISEANVETYSTEATVTTGQTSSVLKPVILALIIAVVLAGAFIVMNSQG